MSSAAAPGRTTPNLHVGCQTPGEDAAGNVTYGSVIGYGTASILLTSFLYTVVVWHGITTTA